MTTERERLERQWRKNNPSRSRPKNPQKANHSSYQRPKSSRSSSSYPKRRKVNNPFQDRLIMIISFMGILLVLKHAPQFIDISKIPEVQQLTRYSKGKTAQKPIATTVGDSQALQQYDFTQIDNLGASLNYQGSSVKELANQLNGYVSTDLEKARLIYAWIAHHVAYDFEAFSRRNYGDVSPQGVLVSRKGVCSGYANLYRELAQNMGLEAEVISGYSKGYGYAVGDSTEVNHAWNAVKINGAWYLVDSTWGAGYIQNNQFVRKFKPFYFATPPNQFIYDHLPTESYWQLLTQPYSKEQFEQLPDVSSVFFEYQIKPANHLNHTIQVNNKAEILLDVPENVVISAGLSHHNNTLADNYTLIQKGQNVSGVYVTFPSAGTYDLKIFAKPKGQQGEYHHAISYRIIASQAGQPFPITYGSFSNNKAYLTTPLQQILPANQSTYFQLNVPNAQEVQVISERSSTWTPLSGNGSFFEGNVLLEQGKVIVVAKFPHQSSYHSLIEYEAR